MNPIDKMAIRAIWRQEGTGIRAVDGFVKELGEMSLSQLALLYVEGRAIRIFVAVEMSRRVIFIRCFKR